MTILSFRLSVNPSKTEFLIIRTPQQRSKLTATSLTFQGSLLTPTDSTRNLGFIFDKDLSAKHSISLPSAKPPTFKYVNYAKSASPLIQTLPLSLQILLYPLNLITATPSITIFLQFLLIVFRKFKMLCPVLLSRLLDVTIISLLLSKTYIGFLSANEPSKRFNIDHFLT